MRVAGSADGERAQTALAELCERYWYPVYTFLRRRTGDGQHAEDLTQGLFCELLERGDFAKLDPERGRFRSFLLTAASHHLARAAEFERAEKRGGGRKAFSIDRAGAETRLRLDPADGRTPERAFERAWALTQLECALERVEREYAQMNQKKLFAALKPFLAGRTEDGLGRVAKALRMEVGAVRVALHRARRRLGQALRAEVAETVSAPGEVESEIDALFESLAAERPGNLAESP